MFSELQYENSIWLVRYSFPVDVSNSVYVRPCSSVGKREVEIGNETVLPENAYYPVLSVVFLAEPRYLEQLRPPRRWAPLYYC